MSTGTEDFEELRKLLKVKRYEQPPPGYFNGFSTRVMTRLERDCRSTPGLLDRLARTFPWLKTTLRLLEQNPIGAGIFGVGVCGLVISGAAFSQIDKPDEGTLVLSNPTGSETVDDARFLTANSSPVPDAFGQNGALFSASNNPSLLFAMPGSGSLTATPVNYIGR